MKIKTNYMGYDDKMYDAIMDIEKDGEHYICNSYTFYDDEYDKWKDTLERSEVSQDEMAGLYDVELENCEYSEKASEKIEKYKGNYEIYSEANEYMSYGFDVSSWETSEGDKKIEIADFSLDEGDNVGVYLDYDAYIEKDEKKYIFINSGENEASFILEAELTKKYYVIYEAEKIKKIKQ